MSSAPAIGVIGGTGLYDLPGLTRTRWVTVKTPFGAPSDQFLTGEYAGRRVVFLPRHGRGHRLLPSELNHRANLWALKKLGVAWVLSVSAVGSLQKKYRPRDLLLPDQFLDRTKQAAAHTFFGRGIVAHIAFAEPVCHELRAILYDSARAEKARVHNGGTYVCMEGPAFSTRAESRINHQLGGAVIGMTNLGEAKCAREAEIAYANLALVTDYDCWDPNEEHVTLAVILDNLQHNTALARAVLARAIPQIPTLPGCRCQRALEHAIFTDRRLWPARTIRELRPLLARFLERPAAPPQK